MVAVRKDIIYPVFLECIQFTTDAFWKSIFEDLAYGKPPYGTYITKDFICCNYKDKDFSYKIERKDPKTIYDELHHLFSQRLGILSSKERNKKKADFYKLEESVKDNKTWAQIKKKGIKDLLIEMYVIKMQKTHMLSIKQSRYLLSLIFLSMIFKVITSKDIHYQDGEIQNIDGINFSHKAFELDRNIYDMDINIPNELLESEKGLMSKNWEKFIEGLKKKHY